MTIQQVADLVTALTKDGVSHRDDNPDGYFVSVSCDCGWHEVAADEGDVVHFVGLLVEHRKSCKGRVDVEIS